MKHLGKNAVIVLALLAAGFFTAYLRFQPYLGKVGKLTDGHLLASLGCEPGTLKVSAVDELDTQALGGPAVGAEDTAHPLPVGHRVIEHP